MKKIITFINNKICEHKGHGDELSMTHKEWAKHVQKELSYK